MAGDKTLQEAVARIETGTSEIRNEQVIQTGLLRSIKDLLEDVLKAVTPEETADPGVPLDELLARLRQPSSGGIAFREVEAPALARPPRLRVFLGSDHLLGRLLDDIDGLARAVLARRRHAAAGLLPELGDRVLLADEHPRGAPGGPAGARRRRTALMRASSSRGLKGLGR